MTGRTWAAAAIFCIIALIAAAGYLGFRIPPVSRPAPPGILVEYHRMGGTAGTDARLVIFDNGMAVLVSGHRSREFVVNQSELAHISGIFEKAGFLALEHNYTARRGVSGLLSYSITYRGKTVKTEDTSVPQPVESLIEELNRMIAREYQQELTIRPLADIPAK